MKHTRRKGGGDLATNPYFNSQEWLGTHNEQRAYSLVNVYQCVYWGFQRFQEDCEKRVVKFKNEIKDFELEKPMFNRYGFPNAAEFYPTTNFSKTTKASEARLGDIICYGVNWGSGCGHVRIIEDMDDEYFYCSGANEKGNKCVSFGIKVKKEDGDGDYGTNLMGYIHNDLLDVEEKINYEKKFNSLLADIKKVVEKYE